MSATVDTPLHSAPAHVREASVAVDVDGVFKHFGDLPVLEDIRFTVAAGTVHAIVGASGCGKSTLLNIVAGLQTADRGSVRIAGVDLASRAQDSRQISYMFQEDRLLPWRTVIQNAEFGLEASALPAAQRRARAREMLAMTGLSGFENAFPHELSGGMRSRVALARSLAVRPYLLLMDEPFSKLDPHMRAQMHEELLRLREQMKMTVIIVTHDVEEAVVLADRVVVLRPRPGRIREEVLLDVPRPRDPLSVEVTETVRRLRALI